MNKGFTMIEVLIVSVIMVMLAGFLINNFSRQRNDLASAATGVVSDIREAQGLAISGAAFGELLRCGYGVSFQQAENRYYLYAGPDSAVTDCATDDHEYTPGEDDIIRTVVPPGATELVSAGDVFFEPPLPYTYLDGARGGDPLIIIVRSTAASCPGSTCRTINITSTGRVYISQ